MIIAGLTGGIATGKSTAAALFKEAGAFILDADRFARQAVEPGEPAWHDIQQLFGRGVLNPDGSINRTLLGELVFNNAELRIQLERVVHPHVLIKITNAINQVTQSSPHAVVIEDIPLLFEKGWVRGLDEIIVVYTPAPLQLTRLMQRDGLALSCARARIRAQMPIEEKCRRATIVINNSGDPSAIKEQVAKIYADLASRARHEG